MTRLEDKVSKCTTWKQLFHAALAADEANEPYAKGVYFSGIRFCSAELLNQRLHEVRNGKAALTTITRNHGLRAKAEQLLMKSTKV